MQKSRDPNTLSTFVFKGDAHVIIWGNSLMFFEQDFKESLSGRLEERE